MHSKLSFASFFPGLIVKSIFAIYARLKGSKMCHCTLTIWKEIYNATYDHITMLGFSNNGGIFPWKQLHYDSFFFTFEKNAVWSSFKTFKSLHYFTKIILSNKCNIARLDILQERENIFLADTDTILRKEACQSIYYNL